MKTILAATDFSLTADNACVFAYELAKSFKSKLIIYSAYQEMPIVLPALPVMATPEDMKAFVEEQLMHAVKRLDPDHSLNIDWICSEAPPATGVLKAARENNADLLVTGMKGAGKAVRKVLGSTVSTLINQTTIPMIVVPEHKKYRAINTVALASETDLAPDNATHLLAAIREVVEKFNSKLYVVRVAKNKMKEAFAILYSPSIIQRNVRDLNPAYECVVDKDVTAGLKEFIKNYKVDMLAMFSHPNSLLARWLGGSSTQHMIFETEIPLLIIPTRIPKERLPNNISLT